MPVETASRSVRESERQITPQLVEAVNRGLEYFATKETPLPMTQKIAEIHEGLMHYDTLILEAATGSGKSTAGPLIALENAIRRKSTGRILITQPRRDAAEGIAKYVGNIIGEKYVGYRFKGAPNTIGPETRLEFIMERSLLNELRKDIKLEGVDTVILDEIHEGNLDVDAALVALEISQQERAKAGLPPLKLILTSATLNPEMLKKRFKGSIHIEVPGKMYEVRRHFEETPVARENLIKHGAEKVAKIIEQGAEGDILMFWPGAQEIKDAAAALKEHITDPEIQIVSLMGGDESGSNIEKIQRAKNKTKTIFLASKVAETSLTFDNVKVVIDSGLDRSNIFDPKTGLNTLKTFDNSQSSAIQRAGRAGRVSEGDVYFLYTEEQFNRRQVYTDAKILQTDLTETVFLMKTLGLNIDTVDFVNKPTKEQLNHAKQTLMVLGAMDNRGNLTEIGEAMTKYNIDPRIARMLVEGERRDCFEEVSVLASILAGEKSVFELKGNFAQKYKQFLMEGQEHNDIATLISVWNKYIQQGRGSESGKAWGKINGIKTYQLYEASSIRNELFRNRSEALPNQQITVSEESLKEIMECIARGLAANLVVKSGDGYIKAFGGTPITIANNSSLFGTTPEYFLSGRFNRNEKTANNGDSLVRTFAEYNMEISKESYQAIVSEIGNRAVGKTEAESIVEENSASDSSENHRDETHSHPHAHPEAEHQDSHAGEGPDDHEQSSQIEATHDSHGHHGGHDHEHSHGHDDHSHHGHGHHEKVEKYERKKYYVVQWAEGLRDFVKNLPHTMAEKFKKILIKLRLLPKSAADSSHESH